jgi:hypothetical protein
MSKHLVAELNSGRRLASWHLDTTKFGRRGRAAQTQTTFGMSEAIFGPVIPPALLRSLVVVSRCGPLAS